ncbi:MAG: S-ribosylhomocysteine lyase [Muribaculaceae bacterium]|nr:S-ribosylhomocysteine lyase [Muribaculaceae bacterium]
MEKIASFQIDHTRLQRGIYVSRKDFLDSGAVVTTFDIRMKLPNREPAVSQSALHTIEHLAATFLRNHPVWGDKIVYWGPMGCCTGNYLLVKGDLTSLDIAPLVKETFEFIVNFEGEIPGANSHDCGNYMLNNLPMAKWEARKYLVEILNNLKEENLNYPNDEEMV